MRDVERIEQRLSAVERVVVDGDVSLERLSELSALTESVAELEDRLSEQERRIATLEASVQSVEGYVGNVESVNDDVERHAAAAIATADRLERRIDALEVELDDLQGGILESDEGDSDGDVDAPDDSDGPPTPESVAESNAEAAVQTAGTSETSASTRQAETAFEFGSQGGQPSTNGQASSSFQQTAVSGPDGATPEQSVAELFESDGVTTDSDSGEPADASKDNTRSSPIETSSGDEQTPAADQQAVAAAVGDDAADGSSPDESSADSGLLGSLRSRFP